MLAGPDLWRAGYSPDEEFTDFAVRGIVARGLPLLPSGLLYDRGLAYSYASWAVSLPGVGALPAGRLVSLTCAVLALAVAYRELRRMTSATTAAVAVAMAAASLPFWVSATTARFYGPFLLGEFVLLAWLARADLRWQGLAAIVVTGAATRWMHELAFTLVAVPLVALMFAAPGRRRVWLARLAALVAGLVVGQAAIFVVHAAAPPSNGDVMVKRFFLWQVLNLFERPPLDLARLLPLASAAGGAVAVALAAAVVAATRDSWQGTLVLVGGVAAALGQLGIAPVAAMAAIPLAPPRVARALTSTGLVVFAAGGAFWALALVAAGISPRDALARIGATAFVYPLDMFSHLVTQSPWLVGTVLAGLLARAGGRGGPWTAGERALHLLWLGWVLWFGVIESGITARYLLLPVTFMLMAIAVDAAAIVRSTTGAVGGVVAVVAVVLALMVTAESWYGPWLDEPRAAQSRPTLDAAGVRAEIQPDDLVVAVDELAALTAAGRLDAWLVLDEFFRERFVVMRGGQPTGTYTGAPAAPVLLPLVERAEREHRRLIAVDVLKDAPGFGPMDVLVPRQLARENLRADVVAESGGFRLLHVVRPVPSSVASLAWPEGRPSGRP